MERTERPKSVVDSTDGLAGALARALASRAKNLNAGELSLRTMLPFTIVI